MSETPRTKDEAEQKAEQILTRFPDSYSPSNLHVVMAVAAEIANLKAERDAALKKCDFWEEEARRYAQNSGYWRETYVRGLKRAREIADSHHNFKSAWKWIAEDIQAEIDKAKAGK